VTDRLHEALVYRAHGLHPIPFYPHSKTPAFDEGEIFPFRERPPTAAELRRWFAHGDCNVGLITGAGGLVVLDIDGDPGRQSIKGLPLPATPTVRTADGFHAHFHANEQLPTRIKILPGVDILADNWQVLMPSSIHPDGAVYAFEEGATLADLDRATVPPWVMELVQTGFDPTTTVSDGVPVSFRRESLLGLSVESFLGPAEYLLVPQTFPATIDALGGWPDLLRREDVNLRCAAFLGLLSVPIGGKFACVLPGHPTDRRAASVYWDAFGKAPTFMLKYRDWHYATGAQCYNQADVFAAKVYGTARQLRGPETTVWQLRLLLAAGVVLPYPVKAPVLPRDTPRAIRRVYDGLLDLLRAKWLHTPDEPTAFSWRFAAAWCGMHSTRQVVEAMQWLITHGYVRQVGSHRSSTGRKMALFVPGSP
jgi:hypothetical protein